MSSGSSKKVAPRGLKVGPVGMVFALFNEVTEYVYAVADQVLDACRCEERWVLGIQAVGGGHYLLIVYRAWCISAVRELQVTFS